MSATAVMEPQAGTDERELVPPQWWTRFQDLYKTGSVHAFRMTGDIEGTAVENISVRGFILANLAARRDVVAVYHIAGGIEIFNADEELPKDDDRNLPKQTRRERALNALGIVSGGTPAPAPSAPTGSLAALQNRTKPKSAPAGDPFAEATRPLDALAILSQVVIDHADTLIPEPPMQGKGAMSPEDRRILVTLLTLAKNQTVGDNGNMIFLLARDGGELHADLRTSDSGWAGVEIALPDRQQRLDYLRYYLDRRERRGKKIDLLDRLTVEEVANLTAGLSLRNIEDVLLGGAIAGGLTRVNLKAHKDDIVTASYSDVVEMIDPLPNGFDDLGGAEAFKRFCMDRIVSQVRAGRDKNVARGILLVGPPGTSKTFGVRALAGEIAFTAAAIKSEKILGGVVGESERKLGKALGFAKALAPCVLFVDEIDQSDMAQRGNNSGNPVAKNLFSMLMQFASDETLRGKVILVLASNRPDILDPALIRSGRIDAILPMLLPEREQRAAIVRVQARTQDVRITDEAVDLIADSTEGWNAADLTEIVRDARLLADDDGMDRINVAHAEYALDDMRPSGLDKAEAFTQIAIQAVNKKRFLPEKYRPLLNNREQIEANIAAAKPLDTPRERGEREF